ncbi:MAG: FAD-dependent oxidoreductase [Deltaproteobacteria bacterium]|nr:FAD-dependent oxidoreductase [Deltaproteobacteria bacterium]
MNAKAKVLVAGGGFAGLETAFYLRLKLKDRVDITLVSDKDHFLYKPNTIYIPFGMDPEKLKIPLTLPTKKQNMKFIQAQARGVNPESRLLETSQGDLPYDYLVLATGSRMRPEEIPGMSQYAQTIFTPDEMLKLRASLGALKERAREGKRQKLLFLVPPNNKCSGPLYEIVFMADYWLREQGVRDNVDITYSTYEKGFIQAFGPRLDGFVTDEFSRLGIDGHREYAVERITASEVVYRNGESLPYDVLVSFPPYMASTPFPGLPADDRGFIATELETRKVQGYPEIYAPGDNGDFPVKQAFMAFLQADATASHLARQILPSSENVLFHPTAMCVMEQFSKATFAKVPLRLTGDPDRPLEVPESAYADYKLGSSKPWRLGKKLLGYYLPWRFRAGKPFHAGAPWTAMEAGLKVMSSVLAS